MSANGEYDRPHRDDDKADLDGAERLVAVANQPTQVAIPQALGREGRGQLADSLGPGDKHVVCLLVLPNSTVDGG